MNDENKLHLFLAKLRKDSGLTQEELGERIGTNNKTISKWEQGIFLPDITCLTTIADFYNITVDELLRCEKKNHKKPTDSGSVSKMSNRLKEMLDYFFIFLCLMISLVSTCLLAFNNEILIILNLVTLTPSIIFNLVRFINAYKRNR